MPFRVYIDESGETGILKVRDGASPGASPYFVVGAVVFQPATGILAKKRLEDFRSSLGKTKWRHATDLDHAEKVYLSRIAGDLNGRYFAVISRKKTLGEYGDQIEYDPQKFYNKCVKYLLELVCSYLKRVGANEDDISVVLERRNHDYDAMLRFLQKVKENPIYKPSKSLDILNVFSITTTAKGDDPLLEFADLVSHAVFQLTNKTPRNFGIPETRYFVELSRRFAVGPRGEILGYGVKCIHNLESLMLDTEIENLLKSAKGQTIPLKR